MPKSASETDKKPRETADHEMVLLIEGTQKQRLERRLKERKLRRGLTVSEVLRQVNTRKPRNLQKKP